MTLNNLSSAKPNPNPVTSAVQQPATPTPSESPNQADPSSVSVVEESIYSCHPVKKLQFGEFKFENSVLKLAPAKAAEFDSFLVTLPLSEQLRIKKISTAAADALGKNNVFGTKQFDSAVGRQALVDLERESPVVGTVELGTEKPAE